MIHAIHSHIDIKGHVRVLNCIFWTVGESWSTRENRGEHSELLDVRQLLQPLSQLDVFDNRCIFSVVERKLIDLIEIRLKIVCKQSADIKISIQSEVLIKGPVVSFAGFTCILLLSRDVIKLSSCCSFI